MSKDVDWEVGAGRGDDPDLGLAFRIDIVTEEKAIFEVKRWGSSVKAEVASDLTFYQQVADTVGVTFTPSSELRRWGDRFFVGGSIWDALFSNASWVYVWGVGNPPGHIYFTTGDKIPDDLPMKIMAGQGPCLTCHLIGEQPVPEPVVPEPIPVPA
jgi:hypothetical protein